MKVAIFVETYVPLINGVVTHVKVLKEGLEALGHEVLVVKKFSIAEYVATATKIVAAMVEAL